VPYSIFQEHEGSKLDIVEGQYVVDPEGFLTLSRTPGNYVAYINDSTQTISPIVPITEYRAQEYKLRKRDCVTLTGRWLDEHYGTQLLQVYTGARNSKFTQYFFGDFADWFTDNGFELVDVPQHGDVIFYNYSDKRVINHIGICIDGTKILHHMPNMYSSLDPLDASRIRKVLRYGNT
jgi:cell wall-associated NlpC family hydrolase